MFEANETVVCNFWQNLFTFFNFISGQKIFSRNMPTHEA